MADGATNGSSSATAPASRPLAYWGRIVGRLWGTDSAGITLRKGAAGAFAVQVFGAGLGLIVHLVIARLLGAEQYGDYALTLAWMSLLCVPALLGQDTAVVRFLPSYLHRGAWGKAKGLYRGASAAVLITSLILAAFGALVAYKFRARLGLPLEQTLLVGFVLLPVLTQLQLNGAFHRALKRAISAGIFNNVIRPLVLMGLVLGLWGGLPGRWSAPLALLASTVAALIALACSLWFLGRAWPPTVKAAGPVYEFRAWGRVGAQLSLASAIWLTLSRLDVLVIGGLAGSKAAGLYYVAVRLAAMAGYGVNAVNTLLAPMIAERYSAGEHEALAKVTHQAAWLAFAVTTTSALALAMGGYWVLGLFGHDFTAAYVPLLIILAGQCVNAATGPVGNLMTMTRFERQVPVISGSVTVLNLLLCVLLIPLLGMIGAAIATTMARIALNLAALVLVSSRVNINPTIF